METHPLDGFEELDEQRAQEVPEDVAILYSWANMEGAKYQDFSENRREHRAQMRLRAAERLQLAEQQARADLEAAEKQAEIDAAAAQAAEQLAAEQALEQKTDKFGLGGYARTKLHGTYGESGDHAKDGAFGSGSREAIRIAAERDAEAMRAAVATEENAAERRSEQELADARASAVRQVAHYAEAGLRGRLATSLDSDAYIAGKAVKPYSSRWVDEAFDGAQTGKSHDAPIEASDGTEVIVKDVPTESHSEPVLSGENIEVESLGHLEELGAPAATPVLAVEVVTRIPVTASSSVAMSALHEAEIAREEESALVNPVALEVSSEIEPTATIDSALAESTMNRPEPAESKVIAPRGPAWFYPRADVQEAATPVKAVPTDGAEPLQHAKERIASRWFALRRLFAPRNTDASKEQHTVEPEDKQAPIVAVYSIAGGVGKTSLVATLGRTLSSLGERVLLNDIADYGMMPFYFGSGHRASGLVRVFSPPAGAADAPIRLVSYEPARAADKAGGQSAIVEDILENSKRTNRVLIDLNVNCSSMMEGLSRFKPTILVPLMPDMNSVISIDTVEKLFGTILDADGQPLQPVYVLNQFDAALPLHLDIREVLKQHLGERLLPFVIPRSPAVAEALAEGMTVVDYDPGSAVTADYLRAANWLQKVAAPVAIGFRNQRWSER